MANLEGLLGTLLAGAPGIISALGQPPVVFRGQEVGGRSLATQAQFGGDTGSALIPNVLECGVRRPRNPTTVNVPDPCNSKIIDTYVKAPRTTWKVVARSRRRGCRRR